MKKIIYVGMDVHSRTNNLAAIDNYGEILSEIRIDNDFNKLKKFFKKLRDNNNHVEIKSCYEAGPTGFGLARKLNELNYNCIIVAPGKIPKKSSDRIKNDKRDAMNLAILLKGGQLTEINIPTIKNEAVRELIRFRNNLKKDHKVKKQQLKSLLLRFNLVYEGKTSWTKTHYRWISSQVFPSPEIGRIRDRYICEIEHFERELSSLEKEMEIEAENPLYKEKVEKLVLFRGVGLLTALSFCCEIGDFRRFATAPAFMSFLGLVPSEYSSGNRIIHGRITKTGNKLLRKLLVESSWHYSSKNRRIHPEEDSDKYHIYAKQADERLNRKRSKMLYMNKGKNTITVAIAREMAGFIWGMMTDNVTA